MPSAPALALASSAIRGAKKKVNIMWAKISLKNFSSGEDESNNTWVMINDRCDSAPLRAALEKILHHSALAIGDIITIEELKED